VRENDDNILMFFSALSHVGRPLGVTWNALFLCVNDVGGMTRVKLMKKPLMCQRLGGEGCSSGSAYAIAGNMFASRVMAWWRW